MGDSVLRCDLHSRKNNAELGCHRDLFEAANREKFGAPGGGFSKLWLGILCGVWGSVGVQSKHRPVCDMRRGLLISSLLSWTKFPSLPFRLSSNDQ